MKNLGNYVALAFSNIISPGIRPDEQKSKLPAVGMQTAYTKLLLDLITMYGTIYQVNICSDESDTVMEGTWSKHLL